MAVFKCKMCGGELDLQPGMNIAECPYCGTKQTVPTLDDKLIRLYNRANQYRLDNEFDKAYSAYEAIVAEKNDEAEAYWGMVLSEFGIEYVEDPKTAKRIPTCHRTLVKSISVNENYKSALMFADLERKTFYEDEAEIIDSLQKKILNASAKEEPYDVFICYKETDANGNRTEDSVLAQDIYNDLTNKGFKVFFSRITLEDKLGKDYEPCIFAALTSAKVMLVVTTDSDNCNAVWVKNEWKRYIDFMKTDKNKTLIPVYKNMSPYALPDEFARLQAQDMSKIGAIQDLVRGVEKLIGKGDNSKTGLSESEQKLLSAFEKSQEKKKHFTKIFISMIIGAVLIAIFYASGLFFFKEIFEIPLVKGVDYSRNLSDFIVSVFFVTGGSTFLGTLVSMIFLKKNSFKYAKYIFLFLFVCFSGWLAFEGSNNFAPSALLWLGYAIVGFVTAVSAIIDAIINKKFPVVLVISLIILGVILAFVGTVPTRSNNRDSSVEQIIITENKNIIRSEPAVFDKLGIVNKGETYTVLDTVIVNGTKWIKIRTDNGIEGYINFNEGPNYTCEYLPVDKDVKDEIESKRAKEDADMKASEEAISALNGTWQWQRKDNHDEMLMTFKDGEIHSDGYHHGSIKYYIETNTYVLNNFDNGMFTLTYNGSEIRVYDENGDLYANHGEYATRYE